jgi:hypothetical protein
MIQLKMIYLDRPSKNCGRFFIMKKADARVNIRPLFCLAELR